MQRIKFQLIVNIFYNRVIKTPIQVFFLFSEYATVGYMAKRIQMRKQRFVAIQKIASEKKLPVDCPSIGDPHTLSKLGTLGRCPPGRPSVRYTIYIFLKLIK